ncbi:hypothetical protein ACA910_002108 [Epithemia clementina (nom. ined.)]
MTTKPFQDNKPALLSIFSIPQDHQQHYDEVKSTDSDSVAPLLRLQSDLRTGRQPTKPDDAPQQSDRRTTERPPQPADAQPEAVQTAAAAAPPPPPPTLSSNSSSSSSSSSLKIAWLMSYPNSGTSYTLHLIRTATQTQTATNYASKRMERRLRNEPSSKANHNTTNTSTLLWLSRPVFSDQPTGPFWGDEEADETDMILPKHFALTKTHCGPPCIWCPPIKYVKSIHSFVFQCRRAERVVLAERETATGKRAFNGDNNEEESRPSSNNGTTVEETTLTMNGRNNNFTSTTTAVTTATTTIQKEYYPTTRVTKSVHLIRDPLDNIVSRFRYERMNGRTAHNYSDSREGFRSYCQALNQEFRKSYKAPGLKLLEPTVLKLLVQVPCYSELIRYVEWHNMAFTTEWDLSLESLVVHYSDYKAVTFRTTLTRLLEFLNLTAVGQPLAFVESKTYRDYYTLREQVVAFVALKQMALQTTWQHLSRYAPTRRAAELAAQAQAAL